MCLENAIYLFSIFRIVVHLTRVINRNGAPIEYFSNRPFPIPLSRLFDYINCSSVSAKFNFQPTCSRNLPCLEIINLSSLTFSLFFFGKRERRKEEEKKESLWRVVGAIRNIIENTGSRRRESCCRSPLPPLFSIMLGSLFLEQKTILRGAYLCRELRLERASQIL